MTNDPAAEPTMPTLKALRIEAVTQLLGVLLVATLIARGEQAMFGYLHLWGLQLSNLLAAGLIAWRFKRMQRAFEARFPGAPDRDLHRAWIEMALVVAVVAMVLSRLQFGLMSLGLIDVDSMYAGLMMHPSHAAFSVVTYFTARHLQRNAKLWGLACYFAPNLYYGLPLPMGLFWVPMTTVAQVIVFWLLRRGLVQAPHPPSAPDTPQT